MFAFLVTTLKKNPEVSTRNWGIQPSKNQVYLCRLTKNSSFIQIIEEFRRDRIAKMAQMVLMVQDYPVVALSKGKRRESNFPFVWVRWDIVAGEYSFQARATDDCP
ncbi:hypothetical protein IQ244_19175 [Nostoc sp. LEGE 06077]|uniref:hypothetical protein n=1 Tax=Nostoc sp. LEGE 06077 TaxID=915325 RepID=UPI00187ECE3A|nr:hypothetical protein [Nostoc sp. LEGE 06077]MBE9208620.1 hypothetical protein [Nostoc sp. LEGE 06077]